MGAKKIKQPKKPAKVTVVEESALDRLKGWAEKNYLVIIIFIAAVLLPVIANWGMGVYREYNENKARADYAKIAPKIPAESASADEWKKAIPDLRKFASDHKDTRTGLVARLELAKGLFEIKNYDECVRIAQDALKSAAAGDGLQPLIQYQLASAYDASGRKDEALKEWTGIRDAKVAGMGREAAWRIGRILAERKDYAKAAENFAQALEIPGGYPQQPLIEQDLARARQLAGIGEKQEKKE